MIAPVSGPIAASTAARSVAGIWSKPSTFGPKPSMYLACPPAAIIASVRPWKAPSKVRMRYFSGWPPTDWRLRAILIAASLASTPELVKKTEIGEGRVGQPPRQTLAVGHLEEVGGVPELAGLGRQRLDEMGMGIAERGHGDAGAEVEIALAGRRRQPAAVAALEGDVGSRVDRHDCRRHGLAPSKAPGATPRGGAKTKTPPRWDGL